MSSKPMQSASDKTAKPVKEEDGKKAGGLQGIPAPEKTAQPVKQGEVKKDGGSQGIPTTAQTGQPVKQGDVKKDGGLQGIPATDKTAQPVKSGDVKKDGGLQGIPATAQPAKPATEDGNVKKDAGGTQGLPEGSTADSKWKILSANTRSSRIDEKNLLVGLNNRLAGVIDRNRQLENDNLHLNAEVKITEERLQTVSSSLKTTFEKENGEMRKQLDNAEKEKAKLVLSEKNVRNKLKETEEKLKKRDAENQGLQKELDASKAKIKAVEDDLNKQKADGAKLAKEKAEVEDENKKLKQENEDFKKFNEEHLLTQVELQNALKNKGEELNLKTEVHEQEIKAINTKSETILQKIGDKAKKEFEKKLEDAIKHLRHDCENQMDNHKKEQDQLHQLKEKDLKQQIDKLNDSLKVKSKEITDVASKAEKFNQKIAELEGEKLSLEKKVKGAEEKLVNTETKLEQEIKGMEKELKDLQDDKEKLIGEYQDLMEIKVVLDNEIATYRNLLEGEEDRLNISLQEPEKKVPEEKEKGKKVPEEKEKGKKVAGQV